MSEPEKTEEDLLRDEIEAIEKGRKDHAKASELAALKQKKADLLAIVDLEAELGETNLAKVEVPYSAGCVTMVAARTPSSIQIKRYRYRVRENGVKANELPDTTEAAEELAESCLKYPDKEAFEKVCAARPGLKAQLGHMAAALVVGDAKK